MLIKKSLLSPNLSDNIICPYCETIQKIHCIIRSWKYRYAEVFQFECRCGKTFNFYRSSKSSWIIPKIRHEKMSGKNVK